MGGNRLKILTVGPAQSPNTVVHVQGLRQYADVTVATFLRTAELPPNIQRQMFGQGVKGPLRYVMGAAHLTRIAHELRPDVMEARFAVGYGDIAAAAAPEDCVLAVHCVGSDALVLPKRNAAYRALLRKTFRRADLVVCYGQHIKDAVIPLIPPGKHVPVWVRGIPLPPAPSLSFRASNRPLRLVTTRKLWGWYGHDLAIRVVRKLKDNAIHVRLDVFGDGESGGKLNLLAQELGIADWCFFHGRRTAAEIVAALAECEVYLSTVPSDGISSSLMEAVCSGLYAIVPDIPGNRFFLDNGIHLALYRPSDLDSIFSAIMSYVDRREYGRQIIQENIRAMVPIADIERNMADLHRMYTNFVNTRRTISAQCFVPDSPAAHIAAKSERRACPME